MAHGRLEDVRSRSDQVRLEDLLRGVVIQSGNDASVALAEYLAGGEAAFSDVMNRQAALLGMKNSQFLNATGMPAEDHLFRPATWRSWLNV